MRVVSSIRTFQVPLFIIQGDARSSSRGWAGLSQGFRSCEAHSGTIERKGSKDLAKSSTVVVDQSYLGPAPRASI